MSMIIRCPVLANEPLSTALASANSWHLKKPQKIKGIKIEVIRVGGRDDVFIHDKERKPEL